MQAPALPGAFLFMWAARTEPARAAPRRNPGCRAVRHGRPALRPSRSMQATRTFSIRPLCDARHARRRCHGAKLLWVEAPEPPIGRRPRSDKGQGCTMRIARRNAGGSPQGSGSPLLAAAHAPGPSLRWGPPVSTPSAVMAGFVPTGPVYWTCGGRSVPSSGRPELGAIHVVPEARNDVDARDKRGHDGEKGPVPSPALRVAVACPAPQAYHGAVAPRKRGACAHTRGDPGAER
jgi:hypothetical protein